MDVNATLDRLLNDFSIDDTEYSALLDGIVAQGKAVVRPLLDAMSDPDPDRRYVANEAYSRVFVELPIDDLIDYLMAGDDERLRSEAAYTLGLRDVQSSIDGLILALRDRSPRVRKAAAQALGMFRDPKAASSLGVAQEDLNPIVRQQATIALAMMDDWRAEMAFSQLVKDAQNEAASVRAGAIEALGMLDDQRVVYTIMQALSDSEAEVRMQAARALIRHPDARAIQYLNTTLGDEDEWVRYYASQALYWIEDALPEPIENDSEFDTAEVYVQDSFNDAPVNPDRLIAQLRHDDPNVRLRAVETAREHLALAVAGPMMGCLHDPDMRVRRAAATALGDLGNEMSADWLVIAACHADSILHNNAIRSLHRLGDARVRGLLPYIENDLRHSDPHIRQLGAQTMGILGLDNSVDILTGMLKDNNQDVRIAAATALGQIGDPIAVDPLIRSANDPNYRIRVAVIEAISMIRTPRALFTLLALLRDEEPEVRYSAALALQHLGDVRAVKQLVPYLADKNPDVAMAVAAALQSLTEKRNKRLSDGD